MNQDVIGGDPAARAKTASLGAEVFKDTAPKLVAPAGASTDEFTLFVKTANSAPLLPSRPVGRGTAWPKDAMKSGSNLSTFDGKVDFDDQLSYAAVEKTVKVVNSHALKAVSAHMHNASLNNKMTVMSA